MATRAWLSLDCELTVSSAVRSCLIAAGLAAALCPMPQARAQWEAASQAAPAASTQAASNEPDLVKGKRAYQRNCSVCHGQRAEGGLGPPLQGIGKRMSSDELTRQLNEPSGSMPRMVPSPIEPSLLPHLLAYLLQLP